MHHKEYEIFCDFDGTITKTDTLNDFLHKFASVQWMDIEKEWTSGKIGSKACLTRQIGCLKQISYEQLDSFFDSVEIDEKFIDFYYYIRAKKIPFTVVSDGFDYFIKNVFKRYGLDEICFFSNELYVKSGRFKTAYPYENSLCKFKSGTCKCKVVIDNKKKDRTTVYIGNGLSDICVLDKVDIVFAKDYLANYCKEKKIDYLEFKNFENIKKKLIYKGA